MNKAVIVVLVVVVVAAVAVAFYFMNTQNGGDSGGDSGSTSVTFDPNGGYGSSKAKAHDGKITLPTKDDFTRPGYILAGWSQNKNATPDDPISRSGSVKADGSTYYAIWQKQSNGFIKYNFSAELVDSVTWTQPGLGTTVTKTVGSGQGGENGKVIKAKIVIKNTGSSSKTIGDGFQGYEYYAMTNTNEVCREYAYNGMQYIDQTPSFYNKYMGGSSTIAGGIPTSIGAGSTITLYKFFVIPVDSQATAGQLISVTWADLDKTISV